MRDHIHTALATLVVALLVVPLLAACGQSTPEHVAAAADPTVDVSVSDCGSAWSPGAAGDRDLLLHNADSRAGEVRVVGSGPRRGLVYADVEPFGPGTTVRVHLSLAAGHYALACLMEDEAPVTGPVRTVTGEAPGSPGLRTTTQSALVPAALRYTAWLKARLPRLVGDTDRLRADAAAGSLAEARRDWLAAHLDYQRLGAAYQAFGDLGDRIDGLPQGLPDGTRDRHWTGFHRVEQDLWVVARRGLLTADTDRLAADVRRLPALVRSSQLDPGTLVLRAHEIDENALQFQLTGRDDLGSHSDLASVRAELVGTAAVLRALAPLVTSRVAGAAGIRRALRETTARFARAARLYAGVPVVRLPRLTRERLDAALAQLCERLANVPATLEPRLANPAPSTAGAR